jgi:signal transduction histidine kinase
MAAGAAIIGVYTVAAYRGRRIPVAMVLLYAATGAISLILFPDQNIGVVGNMIVAVAMTAAAFGWGLAARSRRQLLVATADRAERAEADRHARVAEARRAERTRIAAEMHDMLAHRLSMLSLHAGAIELRPNASPEDLAASAGIVRASAHQALDELRKVIGVLRDGTQDDLAPQPAAADLDALLEECRAAGMRIDLAAALPDSAAIPPELGRHAYRVVQEGLTNASKHAPGQPVQLALTGQAGGDLCIEITNATSTATPRVPVPGAGVGLIGLRERIEMLGGSLDDGADSTGRHRLRASIPWPR